MLLTNYKKTAFHPFPCPVCIDKRKLIDKATQAAHDFYVIMCGDEANFMMAQYHDLAPAKMELMRLLQAYENDADKVFSFMKDPYEGDQE